MDKMEAQVYINIPGTNRVTDVYCTYMDKYVVRD